MAKTKMLLEWLGTVAVAVLLALVAFLFIGPRLGWATHPVLSGSMEPALGVGGIIVTQPVKVEDIKVGDIITFQIGTSRVTHRVVEIVNRQDTGRLWFRTKGDANKQPDPQLISSNSEIVPKTVAYVPYVGYVSAAMKNKLTYLIMIAIPALALIGILSGEVWRGVRDERRKRMLAGTRAQ